MQQGTSSNFPFASPQLFGGATSSAFGPSPSLSPLAGPFGTSCPSPFGGVLGGAFAFGECETGIPSLDSSLVPEDPMTTSTTYQDDQTISPPEFVRPLIVEEEGVAAMVHDSPTRPLAHLRPSPVKQTEAKQTPPTERNVLMMGSHQPLPTLPARRSLSAGGDLSATPKRHVRTSSVYRKMGGPGLKRGIFCANRECIQELPRDGSKTPYCCSRCQTREQNLRQRRVQVKMDLVRQKIAFLTSFQATVLQRTQEQQQAEQIRSQLSAVPRPVLEPSSSQSPSAPFPPPTATQQYLSEYAVASPMPQQPR
ncbi:hypothetical protein PAPYR_2861 [Paratrimastix pyriformis]|uniref:Uncharacterized protein n=1 Tax=Paratrimastix pyriformis TaxID=342808 RepID=A0ABQ8UTX0_9EUKA|nr:hypothetical protein PAPYR_2861 [Paratrimastix pyriformis]